MNRACEGCLRAEGGMKEGEKTKVSLCFRGGVSEAIGEMAWGAWLLYTGGRVGLENEEQDGFSGCRSAIPWWML